MGYSRHKHSTELTQLPVFPAHTHNLSALKDSTAAQTRTLPGLEPTAEPWRISFKVEEI